MNKTEIDTSYVVKFCQICKIPENNVFACLHCGIKNCSNNAFYNHFTLFEKDDNWFKYNICEKCLIIYHPQENMCPYRHFDEKNVYFPTKYNNIFFNQKKSRCDICSPLTEYQCFECNQTIRNCRDSYLTPCCQKLIHHPMKYLIPNLTHTRLILPNCNILGKNLSDIIISDKECIYCRK